MKLLQVFAALLLTVLFHAGASGQHAHEMSLMSINIDGSDLQTLVAREKFQYGSPSISRDGRRLLFDGHPTGDVQKTAIFVARSDGSELKRLGLGLMPCWSPDEKAIAFHQIDIGLVVMDRDGVGHERLLIDGGAPRWSPDGSKLAYLRWAEGIRILDLTSGADRPLQHGIQDRPLPGFSWSPDGEKICMVCSDRVWEQRLVIADALEPKAPLRELTKGIIGACASWSADGTTIAFSQAKMFGAPHRIYLLRLAPDELPRMIPGQPEGRSSLYPCFSSDGKRVYFSSFRRDETPVQVDEPVQPEAPPMRR